MSRITCICCNVPLYPDNTVYHPGFVVCEDCDQDVVEEDTEEFEDEEWAYLNATDEDVHF